MSSVFEPLKAKLLTDCAISGLLDIAFFSHLLPRVTILSCIDAIFALFLIMSFLIPFWILSANRKTLSCSCSNLTRLDLFKQQVAEFPYSIQLLINVLYKLMIVGGVSLKFIDFKLNNLTYKSFVEFNSGFQKLSYNLFYLPPQVCDHSYSNLNF